MQKLKLLFTKDGLQYQLFKNKTVLEDHFYFKEDGSSENFISENLDIILEKNNFQEIEVISALNHFALMPEEFTQHESGYKLISYNSAVDENKEELMLSVNKKFGVQFYYTFPKKLYQKIKLLEKPANFNFSGEKFLNSILPKKSPEIHINLYQNQCEFIAINGKKLVLYNNLDLNSEVDFLYFIMFTLNKINFSISETHFYVYGETTENETFISELRKFVKHLSIKFDNLHKQNFILY
ncbi:DUF3822 family protein [Halpernia frigidisoli]|uniref:DUF3822 family protein n=1 Tax=Halpernia frigidisoli TaxID=1125876 RepID=A0A1I3IUX4_9FLAO|nr:DUF3822 family protein [Halpernia frigidisoli]SFI51748.1 Protein of unknown function [Halpernia frigidisoli]